MDLTLQPAFLSLLQDCQNACRCWSFGRWFP